MPRIHPPPQNQKEKKIQPEQVVSVVIGALITPLHTPGRTSLPVLHSPTSEDGEGRPISTHEPDALGLNNSVDDDRIPNNGG